MNAGLAKAPLALLLALFLLLSGCATTQKLGEEDRKKISTVRISSNVLVAPAMYYLGPDTGALFALGGVGAAVAASASVEPGKAIQQFAEKNGIFIEKITLAELDAALRQSGKLKVLDPAEQTDAVINVRVVLYGFSIPHGFSSRLVPVVNVRCEMVDAAGKLLWSAGDSVLPLGNPATSMTLQEMNDDPKRIDEAWHKASHRIAGNIVKAL